MSISSTMKQLKLDYTDHLMSDKKLDELTARAQGWELIQDRRGQYWSTRSGHIPKETYRPTMNGHQCCVLIEKYEIDLNKLSRQWEASFLCANGRTFAISDKYFKRAVCKSVIQKVEAMENRLEYERQVGDRPSNITA